MENRKEFLVVSNETVKCIFKKKLLRYGWKKISKKVLIKQNSAKEQFVDIHVISNRNKAVGKY